MKRALAPAPSALTMMMGLLALHHVAPAAAQTACYVRADAPALAVAAAASEAAPAPASLAQGQSARAAQSHVGMRRKSDKLFDLDISVSGPDDAVCSVAGVARLSGASGKEALAMVVRPDPGRKAARTGTLCQVFVHLTATAVELRTTPSACQTQSLCNGKVELNGQRFDAATRLPAGTAGPCFERRAP